MLYNFRFDREQAAEVLRRVREDHVVAQGWGGGPDRPLPITRENFVPECRDYYKLASTRVPSNLLWMRTFRDGDLLVTPHLPEQGRVSIHVVDGDFPKCYAFRGGDGLHLNHGIRVRDSVGLDGSISIYNVHLASWYGRLSWLRLPVLRIPQYEPEFHVVLAKSRAGEALGQSGLEDYLVKLKSEILASLMAHLDKIDPSRSAISFEALCERLLKENGYQVVAQNQFDGKGADVDRRCVRERTDLTPFEAGQVLLFVQIKKHVGETDHVAVDQLIKAMETEAAAEGCVMSLATRFSAEAQRLAQENGIVLMNGETICSLVLQHMSGMPTQSVLRSQS